MRKSFLTASVVSVALASSLYADSATGPGSSKIVAGDDINGTVHAQAIAGSTLSLVASDSNIKDGNTVNFITYTPNIAIGNGNLITIKVNNGAIKGQTGNNLWLADANSTLIDSANDSNATVGQPIVAKMTNFVASGANYSEMTFKFTANVNSGSPLAIVNFSETNTTLSAKYGVDFGYGKRDGNLSLIVNQGLACAENVTLEVINSKDQSAEWFNVPNTNGPSNTGVTVAKGVYVQLGTDGDGNAQGASTYDGPDYGTNSCPTFNCNISISDEEKAFGSSSSASTTTCPTCSPTLNTTKVLTCAGSFLLKYNSSALITGGGVNLSSINLTTTANKAMMDSLSSIKGELNNNASTANLTVNTAKTSASGALTAGIVQTNDNKVEVTYTANGTSVLVPTVFDLQVQVNGSADVDTIEGFMEFKEQGTPLTVSYLSANANYRSFVRVTSDKAATIQAVIVTEDGMVSSRFDTGYAITATNGGAIVVEASELLTQAQANGFTGAGQRFNATLYVKTVGSVDAVAYQTAGGSQRYLPVGGATGGGKN